MPEIKTEKQASPEITEEQIDQVLKEHICPFHKKKLFYKGGLFMDGGMCSDRPAGYGFGYTGTLECPDQDLMLFKIQTDAHGSHYITWEEYALLGPRSLTPQYLNHISKRDPRKIVREALEETMLFGHLLNRSSLKKELTEPQLIQEPG
jgi:hypothetical protein